MEKNIVINDLVLSLTLQQSGKYTSLLIGVNPKKEATLISAVVATRRQLANLIITLSTENLTREQLLENFSFMNIDIQITDDLYVTQKTEIISEHQWREFLHSIKDLNLWPLIRETGFHELLPEK